MWWKAVSPSRDRGRTPVSDPSLGETAYNAYCKHRAWRSYDGSQLPLYEDQDPSIRLGWEAAANAAVDQYEDTKRTAYTFDVPYEGEA